MSQKKEYRSAARSRRLIRQAFLELLEEKTLEKITVRDIVDRADLNRSTFYTHYPDIYGIVEELQQEILERNLKEFSQIEYRNMLHNPMPYLQSIAAMLQENWALFRKLGDTIQSNHQWDLYRRFLEENMTNRSDIPEEIRNSPIFYARVHFFMGGILNMFQQWAEGKIDCTMDEICEDIAQVIQRTAAGYMETNWLQ